MIGLPAVFHRPGAIVEPIASKIGNLPVGSPILKDESVRSRT
jgi:hypothetical protein